MALYRMVQDAAGYYLLRQEWRPVGTPFVDADGHEIRPRQWSVSRFTTPEAARRRAGLIVEVGPAEVVEEFEA